MGNSMRVNSNRNTVDLSQHELSYVKVILSKVSFDKRLFEKELKKALAKLNRHQVEDLKSWCYLNFEIPYNPVLTKCFKSKEWQFQ